MFNQISFECAMTKWKLINGLATLSKFNLDQIERTFKILAVNATFGNYK
jgi:hypothetical protein